jgi:glycine/D-amino acid oxidase-like deaminating enzyme
MSDTELKDKIKDFLIVGGGLAGTTLAWYLHMHRCSFMLYAFPTKGEASKVAGGVWNPVAMKRVNPGWKMHECLNELDFFSKYVENQLSKKIYHYQKIVHPLFHPEEKFFWENRLARHPGLIEEAILHSGNGKIEKGYDNYVEIQHGGWMDVKKYLEASHDFFISVCSLKKNYFNYESLKMKDGFFEYDGFVFKHLLFCEGWRVFENPFFSFVKLNPAKGEELILKTIDEKFNLNGNIVNKKIILREEDHKLFVAGSTFSWDNLDDIPTQEARDEILLKLKEITNVDFEVVEQRAGVRPATHDRRPVAGEHPKIKNMYILNGFGSKGVLLSPYMCREFINFIQYGKPLPEEVSLVRYYA